MHFQRRASQRLRAFVLTVLVVNELVALALIAALTGLGNWLNGLTGTSAILLGIILGLMMCFDLGGPVNKAAYVFATTGLSAAATTGGAPLVIMATVMAAGTSVAACLPFFIAATPVAANADAKLLEMGREFEAESREVTG